ncbi:MAG TPA: hypothetical protein PK854_00815 [Oscillospiraceae bacterium]|nr:hypothetical protein [Oscillospiraceae bacterium]HPS33795.1 hypothetical protein [Oscillospiraceae bacterium]
MRQSSNRLLDIRGIANGMEGKNYPFDDCMAFIMERKSLNEGSGENQLDYWNFSWITGDGLTQIYDKNPSTLCEYCVSGFRAGEKHIRYVFDAIGYDYTYITAEQINSEKERYRQKVMAFIDKGIPVLVRTTMADTPTANSEFTYCLFVGYEDNGNILLYTNPYDKIVRYETGNTVKQDWIFIGDKKHDVVYADLVFAAVKKMRIWLTLPESDGKCYGAAAFRAWADDVENERFENETDLWANYGVYFCSMATNAWANNIIDAPHASLLHRFAELNPQSNDMKNQIAAQFFRIGNGDGKGGIWRELQNLGGGFNVSNEVMKDPEKRIKIAALLREAAGCFDRLVEILDEGLKRF